ncbi:UPF0182 family protein [Actinophytocola algeriensis]|uniref:UPF0182 protein FHR82_003661 n=1 Tax=Actinophytocola algeriensis TaxID=1768010 RepID=A0A7W7Q5M1_9PSEU|nr:UPF0182 family protein [Actinophytocola algeriensis]MBB4907419.1 hypothetical protein [Actinophytocola algeriensis]MBE1479449.1 uncharacterized membrane protein (UPF0182 family) [Actinophytocola algeriensis]
MATRPPIGMPKLSRRAKVLLSIAGVLILVLIVGARLLDTYVDWLWYGEVDFRSVFTTVMLTRIILFFAIGLLVGGLLAVSLAIAYRSRPVFVPVSGADDPLARYRSTIVQRVRLFGIGIPVVVGAIAGAAGQGEWQPVQLMLNAQPFGQTDPEFGKDVGFYAFTLPFISWLITWLFVSIAIAGIGALVIHYIFGGIRLGTKGDNFSVPARVQLSVIAGLFVVVLAVDYYFERYELLFSTRNALFDGATYTDLNAVLPAKLILMFIAGFCAVAFFVGAFVRNLQLPAIAIVLLILSSILVGWAWPTVLQQFSVKPNEAEKEAASIERNINATKYAFGLTNDKIKFEDYQGDASVNAETTEKVKAATGTIQNIRLLDPSILSRTFTQREGGENFYGFPTKLDVDRYEVNGKVQDYIVAARELDSTRLAANQTSWINRHLVYTHGNGFVAAPANRINRALAEGESSGEGGYPVFTVSDIEALENNSEMDIPVTEPRIYYGELATDYAIVNARGEYDTPVNQDYRYTGKGGVAVDDWFNRFVFFAHYGERNILFSSDISDGSKIMYNRDPRDRVSRVAPWLTVDGDPYPAVVDGRIQWIVDGYTTLDNFPYAQRTPLGEVTNDSLTGVARQENRDISYIRNSVKATVDAFDGTVTLYSIDDKDPVLKAWESVFPGTVKHGEIPEALQEHFRYPEDLFKVQRELLAQYHVESAGQFFSTQTFWDVPADPTGSNNEAGGAAPNQPPYYVLAQVPGQAEPTFQLTSAMTLLRRQFLAAWVSVSSDPKDYGQFRVLRLPSQDQTKGPGQVQNEFETTDEVTENRTLFQNPNVNVIYGNLLTLPVADGLLYVEPIYIEQKDENAFPQLARVLVYFGDRVGFAPTLQEALEEIFGPGAGGVVTPPEEEEGEQPPDTSTPPPPGTSTPPPPPSGGDNPAMEQAVQDIGTALEQLKTAQQSGDFAAQGQALAALEKAVGEYEAAKANPPAGGGG